MRVEYARDGGTREGEACEKSEPGDVAVVVMASTMSTAASADKLVSRCKCARRGEQWKLEKQRNCRQR